MAEKKKIKAFVDKVLHHHGNEDELNDRAHDAESQESYEDQGEKASTQAPEKSKPKSRSGTANPTADYQAHPKFAKFQKRGN